MRQSGLLWILKVLRSRGGEGRTGAVRIVLNASPRPHACAGAADALRIRRGWWLRCEHSAWCVSPKGGDLSCAMAERGLPFGGSGTGGSSGRPADAGALLSHPEANGEEGLFEIAVAITSPYLHDEWDM